HPLLASGPDRYARRLAAWGLALGVFEGLAAAECFRAELFAALAMGVISPGPQLPFGARVHPIAGDTAIAPEPAFAEVGSRAFEAAALALRAGAGVAAGASPHERRRLAGVAEAVRRCEGDAEACADPAANQALSRAALTAREAGVSDAAIAEAIA